MKQVIIAERALRIFVWTLVGLAILGGGIKITGFLISSAPEAAKEAPVKVVPTVEVAIVQVESHPVIIQAQGEVMARRATQIAAEVGGRVVEVSPKFEAGEVFEEGELMVRLDPVDYRAAHANALAGLENARLELALELANGERARRDWDNLGRGDASDLVLRKPQLASTRAAVASAEAAVEKALRDLERTEVRALYACRVEKTHLDLGATVGAGMVVADVMSLGAVEVRLPLSLEDYGYIKQGEDGILGELVARARLGGEERSWTGSLIRSEGFIESSTRSISVVARFGSEGEESPPVGLFVDVGILGRVLEQVVVLPRVAMVEPAMVQVVTPEGILEFRPVEVLRTNEETVIIRSGLREGEQVCVTTLNAPINGMEVRVVDESSSKSEAGEGGV